MSYPVILPNIGHQLAEDIDAEIHSAKKFPPFYSLHEAYAVILEELDEVWEITKLKKCNRDREHLRKELIQVAAMAIRAINTMDYFVGGDV